MERIQYLNNQRWIILLLIIVFSIPMYQTDCRAWKNHTIARKAVVEFVISDTNKVINSNTQIILSIRIPRILKVDSSDTLNIAKIINFEPVVDGSQFNDTSRCATSYNGFVTDQGKNFRAQFHFKGNFHDTFIWETTFDAKDTGVFEFEAWAYASLKVNTDKGDKPILVVPVFQAKDRHFPLIISRCPGMHLAPALQGWDTARFYGFRVIP